MRSPSKATPRNGMGSEPDASTTCFACSVRFDPSWPVNSTLRPASSLPWPASGVTPAALKSWRMPCVLARTIPALRFCIAATSKPTPDSVTPWIANSCSARW